MKLKLTHQYSGFNTDERYDRTVRLNGEIICRVIQYPPETGPWRFDLDDISVSVSSLDDALKLIKKTVQGQQ